MIIIILLKFKSNRFLNLHNPHIALLIEAGCVTYNKRQIHCITNTLRYNTIQKDISFLLMDVNIHERSGQSNCTRSLTHSILINLFIKLELNNVLLPPLLSIVFVQECSVVFRKVFDEGRLESRTFFPEKWRAWVRICRLIMAAIVVSRLYSFSFVNMMFSDYQLLLTRR